MVGAGLHVAVVPHGVPGHILASGVLSRLLGELLEIIAGAKALALALQDNNVDGIVLIGQRYRRGDLPRHFAGDRVQPLRAIESNAGDTVPGFIA